MFNIKYVLVFDLDNTILCENNVIIPPTFLLNNDICINTLRSPAGMLKALNIECMNFPSIHFGGSLIYDTFNSKTLYYNAIDKNDFNLFVNICDNNKINYRTIYIKNNAISSIYTYYDGKKISIKENIDMKHIPKIKNKNIKSCDIIAIYTEKEITSGNLNCYNEGKYYIYTSPNSNKGNATLYLKKLYSIDKIYAFGNSEYDYSMLDIADCAYFLGTSIKYNDINHKQIESIIREVRKNESI